MNSVFDQVADIFDTYFKMQSTCEHSDIFSISQLLGEVKGLTVLDVGCGTGFYSRKLREWGAAKVVGVDISTEMLRIARLLEQENPLGIEYIAEDVANIHGLGQFDCATGIFFLHYASSQEQLYQICQRISQHLKAGGRFISYQLNPDFSRQPGYYKKYDFNLRFPLELIDGSLLTFTLAAGEVTTPEIPIYYWSQETLENAFRAAGFSTIRWVKPQVSEQGIQQYGQEFWQDYLDCPDSIFIECIKSP